MVVRRVKGKDRGKGKDKDRGKSKDKVKMAWVMKSIADCLTEIEEDSRNTDDTMEGVEETSVFESVERISVKLEKIIFMNEARWLEDFSDVSLRCVRGGLEAHDSHIPGAYYIDGHYENTEDINRDYEIKRIFEMLPLPFVYTVRKNGSSTFVHQILWLEASPQCGEQLWKIIEFTKAYPPSGGANTEDVYFYISDSIDDIFLMAIPHCGESDKNGLLSLLSV